MQSTDNRGDTFYSRSRADMIDGVDQPAMAAASQDDEALPGLEPHRQFIDNPVRMCLLLIQEKRLPGIFKGA